ncbi:MAG: hypothetical protein JO267_12570 [Alphaproteobacteria bacterium]|nr:hypothetical protein [Alphaproteobacteria bacterium]
MSAYRSVSIAAVLGVLAAGNAGAATLGDARVGFSAERVLVIDGHDYVGRMWNMPGKQRHEQDLKGLKPVFILRADTALAEIVLPSLHTVVQLPFPPELAVLSSPDLTRTPTGTETVNGIATTKYAIDQSVEAGHAAGALWLSADGIPMKLDGSFTPKHGKPTSLHWELRHLKIGPQPASLFEAPAAFSKLPPEAVVPLLGLGQKHPAG